MKIKFKMRGRSKIGKKLARGQKNVITDQRTLLIEKRQKEKEEAKTEREAKSGKKADISSAPIPVVLQRFGKK